MAHSLSHFSVEIADSHPAATHDLIPFHREGAIFTRENVKKAVSFARTLYGDRLLPQSSMTLIEHALGVLALFLEFKPDEDAVIACILQHALSVQGTTLTDIEQEYGPGVRMIVSRLHLLSHMNYADRTRSVDDLKVMVISASDEMRVVILKLCCHAYILEHLDLMNADSRMSLVREALSLFAPVAARLGIYSLKYRLEEKAFPVAYPTDNEHIRTQLEQMHSEHGSFLPHVVHSLQEYFTAEGIPVTVMAREKHAYSIFQKMRTKSITGITNINDLIALRIIVPEEGDCYQVLGHLHRLAKPVQQRFKDYISFPKPNGYQSLHTCLIGLPQAPKDLIIEVQIRTDSMHHEAEYGIAAHWMYKEVGSKKVTHTLALADILKDQHFLEDTSHGRIVEHIYVLTPKGDVRELPEGSSPLDFAFLIHTDLGLTFKAARVNGVLVPLTYELQNGDVVEILTHREPRPTLQWLERLATSSARAKLKNYFFSHHRSEFLTRGRDIINADFHHRGLPALDADYTALKVVDGIAQTIRQREDIIVKVGMGAVKAASLHRHLAAPVPASKRKNTTLSKTGTRGDALILVEGAPVGMPYRFAKCCHVNSDATRQSPIVGFITRTGDISVHAEQCGMLKNANRDRIVSVRWASSSPPQDHHEMP